MRRALILIIAIMVCLAYSESMYVPSVVGEGGQLVNLSVELKNGTGRIYAELYSTIGPDTQESARKAYDSALYHENQSANWDAYISIYGLEDQLISGPSGGAALTLLMISEMEKKPIRRDATVTGTIENYGGIGEVGGIVEKSLAAQDANLSCIIIPYSNQLQDELLLNKMSIQYYYASNISEVVDFFIYNKTPKEKSVLDEPYDGRIPEDAKLTYSNDFRKVADYVTMQLEDDVERIEEKEGKEAKVAKYFRSRLENHKKVVNASYLYTGANAAFLTLVEAELYFNSDDISYGLEKAIDETGDCLEEAKEKRPKKTEENFDWIMGGDVRYVRAKIKLDEVKEEKSLTTDENKKLSLLNDALYAKSWCLSAVKIYESADGSGKEIDETSLKPYAKEMAAKAANYKDLGEDITWRIEVVQEAFDEKLYGAAAHETQYIASFFDDVNSTEIKHVWPELYFVHGQYYNGTTRDQMKKLAYLIEQSDSRMESIFSGKTSPIQIVSEEANCSNSIFLSIASLSMLFVSLVILAYSFFRIRKPAN